MLDKILQLITDPSVAIPFWGAVGGAIRAALTRPFHIFKAVSCIALGALFAHLFTAPLLSYLGLAEGSASGIGAVLGITSYELARGLVNLKFSKLTKLFFQ